MGNKRTYIEIDSDFNQAHGIAASISDLLTIPQGNCELADGTLPQAGLACYKAVDNMMDRFNELMDLYSSECKRNKPSIDSDEQTDHGQLYEAGRLKGKKESWEAVHALIGCETEAQGG